MSPRLTLAALRNYVRPVFWRENPFALLSVLFLLMFLTTYVGEINPFHVKNFHAAIDKVKDGMVGGSWWYICIFAPTTLSAQYWRQVSTALAPSVPCLLRAEYNAVLVALGLCVVVLAAPFMLIGAPIFGCLAITCTATIVGGIFGSNGGSKGHSAAQRKLVVFLLIPFMFIGFIPGLIWRVLGAPYWVTVPLVFTAVVVVCLGLRFFPAQALIQDAALEHRLDQKKAKKLQRRPRRAQLSRLLVWRPKFMTPDVLPHTMAVQIGPVGKLLGLILFIAVGTGFGLLANLQQHGHGLGWHEQLQSSLMVMGIIVLFPMSSWLLLRQDWPFIYLAGRYGSRLGFTQALFRAHQRNALHVSALASVLSLVGLLVSGMPVLRVIGGGMVMGLLIFGLSYAAALPLFWRELGGKGVTITFIVASVLVFQWLFMADIWAHKYALLWLLLAVVIAGVGALVGYLAPQRLTKLDWPLDTP